jgi:hypothetical protein
VVWLATELEWELGLAAWETEWVAAPESVATQEWVPAWEQGSVRESEWVLVLEMTSGRRSRLASARLEVKWCLKGLLSVNG